MPENAQSKSCTIEIIVVGNELLNGTTLDTNSHWLSKGFERIGAMVSRKTTVRDDLDTIAGAFREALGRRSDWIVSIGGLGPTFDDMTLQGLAKALGREIERNPLALKYLKESYRRRSITRRRMLKASFKMAEIPALSTPLPNSAGSAPAVLTEYNSTKIVALPGVPQEMKAIFKDQLAPRIRQDFSGLRRRRQLWFNCAGVRESQIAPVTKKIMSDFSPSIYVKSHAMGFDKNGAPLVNFQLIFAGDDERALDSASKRLERAITKFGGRIIRRRLI